MWLGRSVFSSTGDLARQQVSETTGFSALLTPFRAAANGLFNIVFPSECRICGAPLTEISRLPVCSRCISAMSPIEGELCSICGEKLFHFGGHFSEHSGEVPQAENICGMCCRARPAYMRAVAYGAYDGELREL